jgi:hypothetical protein
LVFFFFFVLIRPSLKISVRITPPIIPRMDIPDRLQFLKDTEAILGFDLYFVSNHNLVATVVDIIRPIETDLPLDFYLEYPKGSGVVWDNYEICSSQCIRDYLYGKSSSVSKPSISNIPGGIFHLWEYMPRSMVGDPFYDIDGFVPLDRLVEYVTQTNRRYSFGILPKKIAIVDHLRHTQKRKCLFAETNRRIASA